METRHTPGPWRMEYGCVYGPETEAVRTSINKSVRIALMDRDEPLTMPTERDANARLIAAAPELLEACKLTIQGIHNGHTVDELPPIAIETLRILRAVIAKAEGR